MPFPILSLELDGLLLPGMLLVRLRRPNLRSREERWLFPRSVVCAVPFPVVRILMKEEEELASALVQILLVAGDCRLRQMVLTDGAIPLPLETPYVNKLLLVEW